MELQTAVQCVSDTLTSPQAHALRYIAAARNRLLIDQRNAQIAALVTLGASVKIRDNINPTYLRGLAGTVASTDGKLTTLLLDEASSTAMVDQGRGVLAEGTTRLSVDGIPGAALEVRDAPAEFVELVSFMVSSASSEDLTKIVAAAEERVLALAVDLAPGMRVMVTNTSPKFLSGLTGTIDSIDAQADKCLVLLDEDSTNQVRYQDSSRYTVPPQTQQFPLRLSLKQVLAIPDN